MEHVFRTKPLRVIVAQEDSQELQRELSLFDLIMLGIGATVGSGVFATTGDIISKTAGPAAVISWIVAGVVCVLNAFSFMELSTRVPSSGSTYAYAYHTLGELPAVVAAWLLTLEYGMAGSGVARSWATKMEDWLAGGDPIHNTKYHWLNTDYTNILAGGLQAICVVILLFGVRFSKYFVNAVSVVKVALVVFIVIAGLAVMKPSNLTPFIPERDPETNAFGIQGVISGTTLAFFGYIGFDEVCCLAAETKNPKKTMPRAVIGSVFLTISLSVMASFVLSGMTTYANATNFSAGFNARHLGWAADLVHAGEIVTMPIVVLVSFLAQPRLQYALACDGLMPKLFAKVNQHGVLFKNTLLSGVFFTIVAFCVPFLTLWDIINFGVLLSLATCNACLIVVRTRKESPQTAPKLLATMIISAFLAAYLYQFGYGNNNSIICLILAVIFLIAAVGSCVAMAIKCPHEPNDPGNYSAPLVPFLPFIAILADFYLMAQITVLSQVWSLGWFAAAIISYFAYGYRHSEGRTAWVNSLPASRNSLRTGMLASDPSPSLPVAMKEKPQPNA